MKSIGWLGDAEDILSEIYLAVGHYPETARDISEYIIPDITNVYQVLCQCRAIHAQLVQLAPAHPCSHSLMQPKPVSKKKKSGPPKKEKKGTMTPMTTNLSDTLATQTLEAYRQHQQAKAQEAQQAQQAD